MGLRSRDLARAKEFADSNVGLARGLILAMRHDRGMDIRPCLPRKDQRAGATELDIVRMGTEREDSAVTPERVPGIPEGVAARRARGHGTATAPGCGHRPS